jgi:phosphinothricin acetyltransferase
MSICSVEEGPRHVGQANVEPLNPTIEAMAPADWESVGPIFREAIVAGNSTFDVDPPDWERWDREHLQQCRLVARHEGQVVAWAALRAVSARPVYSGVAEASLYVSSSFRGRGVGKALLHALIDASEQAGIWTLQGSILTENSVSRALVKACGFREVGYRERIGQSGGIWRDTILVERRSRLVGV